MGHSSINGRFSIAMFDYQRMASFLLGPIWWTSNLLLISCSLLYPHGSAIIFLRTVHKPRCNGGWIHETQLMDLVDIHCANSIQFKWHIQKGVLQIPWFIIIFPTKSPHSKGVKHPFSDRHLHVANVSNLYAYWTWLASYLHCNDMRNPLYPRSKHPNKTSPDGLSGINPGV